jgi:hypothetical protein
MQNKDEIKAATNAFFTAFQNEPRLEAEASTSMAERVAILEDMAIKIAKERGLDPKTLIEGISRPVIQLKKMVDDQRSLEGSRSPDAVVSLCKPVTDRGIMFQFDTVRKTEETVKLSEEFRLMAMYELPKQAHAFHQGGVTSDNRPSEYHSFEIWAFENCPLEVYSAAKEIANKLGLNLEVSDDVQSILDQRLAPSL